METYTIEYLSNEQNLIKASSEFSELELNDDTTFSNAGNTNSGYKSFEDLILLAHNNLQENPIFDEDIEVVASLSY